MFSYAGGAGCAQCVCSAPSTATNCMPEKSFNLFDPVLELGKYWFFGSLAKLGGKNDLGWVETVFVVTTTGFCVVETPPLQFQIHLLRPKIFMLLCSALIPIKYEKSKYELQQKNIFNKRELLYYSKFFSHFSAAAISKSNFHVNKLFMGKKNESWTLFWCPAPNEGQVFWVSPSPLCFNAFRYINYVF